MRSASKIFLARVLISLSSGAWLILIFAKIKAGKIPVKIKVSQKEMEICSAASKKLVSAMLRTISESI